MKIHLCNIHNSRSVPREKAADSLSVLTPSLLPHCWLDDGNDILPAKVCFSFSEVLLWQTRPNLEWSAKSRLNKNRKPKVVDLVFFKFYRRNSCKDGKILVSYNLLQFLCRQRPMKADSLLHRA